MAASTSEVSKVELRKLSTGKVGFIEAHGLWSDQQRAAAEEVLEEVRNRDLEAVRVAVGDVHGVVRGKTLSVEAFATAMRNGMDCSPGPFLFDTASTIVFDPFSPGGGLGSEEMTGAADFVLVPDPSTFRVLPWTDGATGWVLADEYFKSGRPVPFSARQLLRRLLDRLHERGLSMVAGIEVEWYLTRLLDAKLTTDDVGGFGIPGSPPEVAPVNLGYQFNIEHFTDELDGIMRPLRQHLLALGLPLRTTEHESGPGQLEFTFDPQPAMEAADSMLLFRSATKQICARRGYHASFMCCPRLAGFDASGWHLHQSLFDTADGSNRFMSSDANSPISGLARHYIGGLLEHAAAASVLTTPTVNGYKRLGERFALAPDRAAWSVDNRGAFIRVLAEPFEASAHIENRAGEPSANPYLYLASQLIAGLDGVERELDPGVPTDDPHAHNRPALPCSLREAVDALKTSSVFREAAGEAMVDFLVSIKESELLRYERATAGLPSDERALVTEWEQREYFRTF
jgi:glutamine synthetase